MPAALFLLGGCIHPTTRPQPAEVTVRVRVTSNVQCERGRACLAQPGARTSEGSLLRMDEDSLVLFVRQRTVLAVPVASISRLEVYRGLAPGSPGEAVRQAGRGALFGAVFGAAVGAATGTLVPAALGEEPDPWTGAKVGAAQGAAIGLVSGAVAGATAGAPVWQSITAPELRAEWCRCRITPPTIIAGQ